MDLDEQLLLTRQAARISELETWLSLMVASYGTVNGSGYQYVMSAERAQAVRARLSTHLPVVGIDFDAHHDRHVIDVL